MEYPPRKFHPNRNRKPEPPSVSVATAAANRMKRELKRLNITLRDENSTPQATRAADTLRDDLIETIPNFGNVNRRQNLVHFDIDPLNSK